MITWRGGTCLFLLLLVQHTTLTSAASISSTTPPLPSTTQPLTISTHESTSSTVETTDQPTTTQATSRTSIESVTTLQPTQHVEVASTSEKPLVTQNGWSTTRKPSKPPTPTLPMKKKTPPTIAEGTVTPLGKYSTRSSLKTSTLSPKTSTSTIQTSTFPILTSSEVLSTTRTTAPTSTMANVVTEPEYYEERVKSLGCKMLPLPSRATIWKANQTHELNLPNQVRILFIIIIILFYSRLR